MIIVAIGKNLPSSFIIINQNSKPILFSVTLGSIAVYAKDFYLKHCSLKLHKLWTTTMHNLLIFILYIQLLAIQLVKTSFLFYEDKLTCKSRIIM
jgi:hypothetical protein